MYDIIFWKIFLKNIFYNVVHQSLNLKDGLKPYYFIFFGFKTIFCINIFIDLLRIDTMNQKNLSNNTDMTEMLANAGYSDKAIKYIIEKPYMGSLSNANQISQITGTCGDTLTIYLEIGNDIIKDARYEVVGCPGSLSAAMAAVDLIKGKNVEDARRLNDGHIFSMLEEIPAKKHHCIQIAVKALHKALDEYNNITGEKHIVSSCQEKCSDVKKCCKQKLN